MRVVAKEILGEGASVFYATMVSRDEAILVPAEVLPNFSDDGRKIVNEELDEVHFQNDSSFVRKVIKSRSKKYVVLYDFEGSKADMIIIESDAAQPSGNWPVSYPSMWRIVEDEKVLRKVLGYVSPRKSRTFEIFVGNFRKKIPASILRKIEQMLSEFPCIIEDKKVLDYRGEFAVRLKYRVKINKSADSEAVFLGIADRIKSMGGRVIGTSLYLSNI